jgi:hypothetical protein
VARDLAIKLAQDRPGELAGLVRTLSTAGINIEGLAEVEGLVHVLVRNVTPARTCLREAGYEIEQEREVVVIPLPDRPGELALIFGQLADAGVNIRFSYLATETRVVVGADNVLEARSALEKGGRRHAE